MMVSKITVDVYDVENPEDTPLASLHMLAVPATGDTFEIRCKEKGETTKTILGLVLKRKWIIDNEEFGPTYTRCELVATTSLIEKKPGVLDSLYYDKFYNTTDNGDGTFTTAANSA